ncbi:MAG: peptide chain release factor-like protein, partial [Candidatus Saccharimonadales bacterium]
CEKRGFKLELDSESPSEAGGYKEVFFEVQGADAYGALKFEAGVHRVQRIPVTESSGRIHTSTVTVAVLPEAEETDLKINQDELRVDVFRASGHGGQSVNTTDSAVRVTHLPTSITVSMQDEKSQIKNREKAMRVLRSRLLNLKVEQEQKQMSEARRKLIGSGERSEKIRTYNFPQDRITDHRINYSRSSLPAALNGDIDDLINKLHERETELMSSEQ